MSFRFQPQTVWSHYKKPIKYIVFFIVVIHFVPFSPREPTWNFPKVPSLESIDPEINSIQLSQYKSYGSSLSKIPLSQKCDDFFKLLLKEDPDLILDSKRGPYYDHESVDMIRHLKTLNIYNQCYISNDNALPIDDLEMKMYPFLSGKYPTVESSDGNKQPLMAKSAKGGSFLKSLKNSLEGDGIVVSICDKFVDEVLEMVRTLRVLGNELPIQFVYNGDLSMGNKQKISQQAQSMNDHLPDSDPIVRGYKFYTAAYPKQEISFVNINECIQPEYQDLFPGFFQKELAYLFNSFENMILMDSDTVLFKPPHDLLNSTSYTSSGAWFFKDRNLPMRMSDKYVQFIQNVIPNTVDSLLFTLPQANTWTDYLQTKFFHYQESGLVLINRVQHFNAMLITSHLSQLQSTFIASWGDKEHFHLGFTISGDSHYEFNKYWSASIGGSIEHLQESRLCSNHPSHIDASDDSLIWINSGSKFCPIEPTEIDLAFWEPYGLTTLREVQKMYLEPVRATIAVLAQEGGMMTQTEACGERYWCAHVLPDKSNVIEFDENESAWVKYVLSANH